MLPLGARFGNREAANARPKSSNKFNHVKPRVQCGKKEMKASDLTDPDQIVTKLKGELFGRMSPDVLAGFLKTGELQNKRSYSFLDH